MADPVFQLPSLAAYQDAQRAAAVEKAPTGFAGMATGAAFDLARSMGYQSRVEKQLADANKIMAEETMAETSANPTEARFNTLMRAAKRFNQLGYTDLVQQIAPELQALQKQALEQAKLTSEAEENKAQTRLANIQAQTAETLLPAKLVQAANEAESSGMLPEAWYYPKLGTWKAVNERDPREVAAARAEGAFPLKAAVQATDVGGISGLSGKDRSKEVASFREQATATAKLANAIENGIAMIDSNPNAGTLPAGVAAVANTIVQNVKAMALANGVEKPDLTREGVRIEDIVANSLPRADAQLKGMVTALVYAQARAADPGGRLSNQDVEVFARQFGAMNPQQLRDTMVRLLIQGEQDLGVSAGAYNIPEDDSALVTARGAIQRAKERSSPKAPAVEAEDLSQVSTEELLQRLNSGR